MIQIDDKLISLDLFEKQFCCDLPKCLGACCVHGQSGAPLEQSEVEMLMDELEAIKPFLKPSGLKSIENQGVWVRDHDGDMVTPLIDGAECAFAIEKDDITFCAIEKAWLNGKVTFRKPISCHLYPIRTRKYKVFTAINYDQWSICQPAREYGKSISLPVYKFLKEPIIRAYGEEFYVQMEEAAKLLELQKGTANDSKS
jgi:hypothetical protein